MIIERLGPIDKVDISLNKETIFLGKNNVGKTYVSYLVYGIFKKFQSYRVDAIEQYISNIFEDDGNSLVREISISKDDISDYVIKKVVDRLNKTIQEDLPLIFNLSPSNFIETKIQISEDDFCFLKTHTKTNLKDGEIKRYNVEQNFACTIKITSNDVTENYKLASIEKSIFTVDEDGDEDIKLPDINSEDMKAFFKQSVMKIASIRLLSIPNIVYIPAERNGINVFRNELYKRRSADTFDLDSFYKLENVNQYPLPISDYMKFLSAMDRDMDNKFLQITSKKYSYREDMWQVFSSKILRGKYEYDAEQDEYFYIELEDDILNTEPLYKNNKILLKSASSSIKSLFGLEHYIKYKFQAGDILFIDEPEMNLDPENQVKIAKILTSLAKLGVKVIISTHSDYLTRATTNVLLKDKISSKFNEFCSNVVCYYFDRNNITVLTDLTENSYIENFDLVNHQLEKEYLDSMEELEGFLENYDLQDDSDEMKE